MIMVSFTKLALLTLGAITATALPTSDAAHKTLEKRDKGAQCWGQNNIFWQSMTINMYGWGVGEPGGCGRSLLDNLKGQCSKAITNWHCNDTGNGNAHVIFNIPLSRAHCVEDAIWLASHVEHVQCQY